MDRHSEAMKGGGSTAVDGDVFGGAWQSRLDSPVSGMGAVRTPESVALELAEAPQAHSVAIDQAESVVVGVDVDVDVVDVDAVDVDAVDVDAVDVDAVDVDGVVAGWACSGRFAVSEVSGWSSEAIDAVLARVCLVERVLGAARVALLAQTDGRDAAARLCRVSGVSGRVARESARAARVLRLLPEIGGRLGAGEVSVAQVAAVGGLAAADQADLLAGAAGQSDEAFARSVHEFRVRSAGDSGAARQRVERGVRSSITAQGSVRITLTLPAPQGAEVLGVFGAVCDAAYQRAHPHRPSTAAERLAIEPRERRLADAAYQVICTRTSVSGRRIRSRGTVGDAEPVSGDTGAPVSIGRPVVVVHVNAETLEAKILPDTPVRLGELGDLLQRAQVYAAIKTGTDPAQLVFGRNRRLATVLQRLALGVLQPCCQWKGCDVPAEWCEIDHIQPWEQGGRTDVINLRFLCRAHHHLRHERDQSDRPSPRRRNQRTAARRSTTGPP